MLVEDGKIGIPIYKVVIFSNGGIFMRHAIVTAGTKGLGRKVTEELLENGYSVTATYRSDHKKADELAQAFKKYENALQILQIDVCNPGQLSDLVRSAYERFGRVDCLVNNAGPYIFERKKLMDYEIDEWNEMMRGNLDAVFHLLKDVLPIMRRQQFGRIVNYGFQGAQDAPGWIYRSAFAAAKSGLVSLTKSIAYEEAEHGITSNMVCPGNIIGKMKESNIMDSRKYNDEQTPVGRSGTGEDIARAVLFFCNDASDMITGTVMDITGGLDVINRHR
ncbi:SDR family oxidoreductase [Salinibacillus xinjiangensis]|uniref:SDR family oxidoreductase n=1 Tax=Salinibacillus xinjiangensis TaxID=1229268 RepID=A0A6G1X9P7_9BACI|nr:SDR family oxidoreductase [Salinibacillus xinjiangensis]MRG87704.1 SDR family oxidoreductase [Salinibacillus xinjiangensis]